MIAFPRIDLGASTVQMRELTVGESLALAKVPERLQEARITKFLGTAIGDEETARKLTVQERYYLLVQYLAVQEDNPLAMNVNYGLYLLPRVTEWRESVAGIAAPVWRQLRGHHVELLELLCENVADWVTCAMAVQCDLAGWAALPGDDATQTELSEAVRARFTALQDLPGSEFEALAAEWSAACMAMSRFMRTGYDNKGITILPVNGGADDAPARFRPSTAFGRVIRELVEYLDEPRQPDDDGLPDDDGGSPE